MSPLNGEVIQFSGFTILALLHGTEQIPLSKEPETLNWISSFDPGDNLLDIGANIGIYSPFAAARNHKVISLEPDALNYALLNLNIILMIKVKMYFLFPLLPIIHSNILRLVFDPASGVVHSVPLIL